MVYSLKEPLGVSGTRLSQARVWGGLGRSSGTLGVSGAQAFQSISQHCWEGLSGRGSRLWVFSALLGVPCGGG